MTLKIKKLVLNFMGVKVNFYLILIKFLKFIKFEKKITNKLLPNQTQIVVGFDSIIYVGQFN